MLYKFKSKAGADVIMLGPQGDQLLRLLGRPPSARGILENNALADAIAALERAVADDEAAFAQRQAEAAAAGEPAPRRAGITLRMRVWPVVELMRRALPAEADLVWGV